MIGGRNLGPHGFLTSTLIFVLFLVSDSLGFSIADSSLLLLHVLEQYKSCHHSILCSFPKGWISSNFSFKSLRNFFSCHVFLVSKQNNFPAVNFPQPQNKLKHHSLFHTDLLTRFLGVTSQLRT